MILTMFKGGILTNENFATVIKKKAAYLAAFFLGVACSWRVKVRS
jgi:hypothetical protein